MNLAILKSRALSGTDTPEVTVEAHLANDLPSFTTVDLPGTEVKEARDHVRTALQNTRFEFPARYITVNFAPADFPKESGHFDLPIALGMLATSGQISQNQPDRHEFAGKPSLSSNRLPKDKMTRLTWSARAYHRTLKTAGTIADLAQAITIKSERTCDRSHSVQKSPEGNLKEEMIFRCNTHPGELHASHIQIQSRRRHYDV